MIVNTDEFYIPAICFELKRKGTPILIGKGFFSEKPGKYHNTKNPANQEMYRAFKSIS